jgi:hypothetical protein
MVDAPLLGARGNAARDLCRVATTADVSSNRDPRPKFKGGETVFGAAEIEKGYGILKTVESRNAVNPDG